MKTQVGPVECPQKNVQFLSFGMVLVICATDFFLSFFLFFRFKFEFLRAPTRVFVPSLTNDEQTNAGS